MRTVRSLCAPAFLDLLLWSRMPAAIASAVIPPLAMALLLVVLTLTVGKQPVALVIQSRGQGADKMVDILQSDKDAYLFRLVDSHRAAEMLDYQEVVAILTVPPEFSQVARTGSADLYLTLNNIDIDFADDIRRSVERSVGQFDAASLGGEEEEEEGHKEKSGAAASNPYHITVKEHDLRKTEVDFLHYQVVPVLILLVLNVGLVGTALLCAGDRERGTARMLALAPVSAWTLVAGRLLGGFLASLVILIPAVGLCLLTKVIAPPADHWPALTALLLSTALCASGLGAILGTALRGLRNIAMASSVLTTYLFFLGGGFTTIAFLPQWLRNLSAVNPIRYAIDGLRQTLFYPDLNGVAMALTILTGTALLTILAGSLVVVRSWKH